MSGPKSNHEKTIVKWFFSKNAEKEAAWGLENVSY